MGMQDRDYYRQHHIDLARRNEESLRATSITTVAWLARLAVLALVCACTYLGFEVVQLRKQLATAERVIQQQAAQMKADRQRSARQAPTPKVEFFK